MCPKSQSGFAAIAAIFILVILAALGAFILSLSSTQHIGAAQDALGSRAYFAAHSGAEWGIAKVINNPIPPCSNAGTHTKFAVEGLQVEVVCTSIPAQEAGWTTPPPPAPPEHLYRVEATACSPASDGCPGDLNNLAYVERRISALIEK